MKIFKNNNSNPVLIRQVEKKNPDKNRRRANELCPHHGHPLLCGGFLFYRINDQAFAVFAEESFSRKYTRKNPTNIRTMASHTYSPGMTFASTSGFTTP